MEIPIYIWIIGILCFIIISSAIIYSIQKRNISKLGKKIEFGDPELKSQVQKIDNGFTNIYKNLAELPRNDVVENIKGQIETIKMDIHTNLSEKITQQSIRLDQYEKEYAKKFDDAKKEFAKDGLDRVVSKASKIIEDNTVTKDEYNKLKNRIETIIGSEIDNHKLSILRNVFSETAQLSVLNWQCRMIKLLKGGFAPGAESELLAQESIPQSKYKSFLKTLIENGLVEDRKIEAYYITAEGEWIFNYINDSTILKGRIAAEIKKETNYQSYIQENLDLIEPELVFSESQYGVEGYLFDLLCRDKDGKAVILELKYPKAERKAKWQIAEYRKKYAETHGVNDARFMLVSPLIEDSFKEDLKQDNIEYKEIPF